MFDPLRTDASRAADAALDPDRDAKIEQLLLDGLDRYFAAQYDQAIAIWTRALFFDRSHPRARAYIERARRALAERQRESEELVHSGAAAFDRGDREEARRLLRDAISRGAPSDEAHALLGRLNRIDQRAAQPSVEAVPDEPRRRVAPPLFRSGTRHVSRSGLVVVIAAVLVTGSAWLILSSDFDWLVRFGVAPVTPVQLAPSVIELAPALPMRGETALARARMLAAGGRLHDALTALDLVRATDLQKIEADRLRADLQQQLIALTMAKESVPVERESEGAVP